MERQARAIVMAWETRSRQLMLLLLAGALLLLASACGGDKASGAATSDHEEMQQTATVEKNGVSVTISPTSGAINNAVEVHIKGVRPVEFAPFATVSFRDSTGHPGEDSLTTDFVMDTRKTTADGSLHVHYRVPANVLIAKPGAQNPTEKAPTSLGPALIVFASAAGEIEVPFTVVATMESRPRPSTTPVALDLGSACKVVSGPDGGSEGLQTWVLRCEDSEHVFTPVEARTALERSLAEGGWSVCGAAAGATFYRKGDRLTTLAFAGNDRRDPNFGKVYLGQSPRSASVCA